MLRQKSSQAFHVELHSNGTCLAECKGAGDSLPSGLSQYLSAHVGTLNITVSKSAVPCFNCVDNSYIPANCPKFHGTVAVSQNDMTIWLIADESHFLQLRQRPYPMGSCNHW